jgi:release factor glutamine methyltransferase
MIEYEGLKIETCKDVYMPAEDSFLFADNLILSPNDNVLEIGSGTGIISMTASKTAQKVTCIDINPKAVLCTKKNIEINNIKNVNVIEGDLFEPINKEKFDLILFNTPYLPSDELDTEDDLLNKAWDGGIDGRDTIDRFLNEVKKHLTPKGKVQLVQSSLSDNKKTCKKLKKLGFNVEITANEHIFFEDITVISGRL